MSPPPPRPAQHLVPEADRELYADRLRCQEQGVISLGVGSSGQAGATEVGRETDFLSGVYGGRAAVYGTMRCTGLPRIVTDHVAVSLPAPVTLYRTFHHPGPGSPGGCGAL